MKHRYKGLTTVIAAELIVIFICNILNVGANDCLAAVIGYVFPNADAGLVAWLVNALLAAAFFGPIFALLILMSRDSDYSRGKRDAFCIVGWFLAVCTIAGGIASFPY